MCRYLSGHSVAGRRIEMTTCFGAGWPTYRKQRSPFLQLTIPVKPDWHELCISGDHRQFLRTRRRYMSYVHKRSDDELQSHSLNHVIVTRPRARKVTMRTACAKYYPDLQYFNHYDIFRANKFEPSRDPNRLVIRCSFNCSRRAFFLHLTSPEVRKLGCTAEIPQRARSVGRRTLLTFMKSVNDDGRDFRGEPWWLLPISQPSLLINHELNFSSLLPCWFGTLDTH